MSESRIKLLKEQINNSQTIIKTIRKNTASHKANGSPSHYQVSGKEKIKAQQNLIKQHKEDIAELKGNKSSNSGKSIFRGNILFLPFRLLWWFVKLAWNN